MQGTYRLAPREIASCALPALLLGATITGLGYFWNACGYDYTVFDLSALRSPLWLMVGAGTSILMAAWLWQVRIRLDEEGLDSEATLGLLRLPAVHWKQISDVRYELAGRVGRKRRILRLVTTDGFAFSLPLGADCPPLAGAPALDELLTTLSGRTIAEPPAAPGRNIELGRESGRLTYAALTLTMAALGMLATWRAHYLDGILHLAILPPLFLLTLLAALRYQWRLPQRGISVFVALLFAAASSGFCWSGGMSLAAAAGSRVPRTFVLTRADTELHWETADSGIALSVTAVLPAGSRQHFHTGQRQQVRVSYGPLGIKALDQDEYVRLVPLD